MGVKPQQSPVEVLDGFKPAAELTEAQISGLVQLSKYGRIATDRDTELPPYARIGEDHDIVAVFDKASGVTGVVHRQLTGSVALDENRTARSYRLIGFKPCGRDEALTTVWAPRQAEAAAAMGDLVESPF